MLILHKNFCFKRFFSATKQLRKVNGGQRIFAGRNLPTVNGSFPVCKFVAIIF